MSLGKSHLKVFVSSCMEELRPERVAVKQLLDQNTIPNFVFEEDVAASGRSPREIYSEALGDVKVYVGIFWQQYGEYTVQEFRDAQALGLDCHVYVKESEESQRDPRLRAFLEEFEGVDSITYIKFSDTDILCSEITKSVIQWYEDQLVKRAVERSSQSSDAILPDQLPCLCDRDPQEIQFEAQIASYFQVQSSRPLLVILPGRVEERHGLYLNRIKIWSLNEYLNKARIRGGKKIIQIRKSPCAMTLPVHFRSEILGLLDHRESGGDEGVLECIKRSRLSVLVIVVRVLASECKGNPQKSLQLIADYLSDFPDTKEDILVSVVVCLEEDRQVPKSHGWWKRLFRSTESVSPTIDVFEKTIKEFQQQYADEKKLRLEILPSLVSPKVADVRRWLDHELVKLAVPYVAEKDIETMFQGGDSLSMDELYIKLTDLLEKRIA